MWPKRIFLLNMKHKYLRLLILDYPKQGWLDFWFGFFFLIKMQLKNHFSFCNYWYCTDITWPFWEEGLREGAKEQKFKGEADLPWHSQHLASGWKGQWVLDTTMGVRVRGFYRVSSSSCRLALSRYTLWAKVFFIQENE